MASLLQILRRWYRSSVLGRSLVSGRAWAACLCLAACLIAGCDDGSGGGDGTNGTPAGQAQVAYAVRDCIGEDGSGAGAAEPFAEGVASGDVTSTSAVLWTRAYGRSDVDLIIAPEDDGVDSAEARTHTLETSAGCDFTVKVRVSGLRPDTRYLYVFRSVDRATEPGVFTTAPAADAAAPVRFVFSGDSDGTYAGLPQESRFDVLIPALDEGAQFFVYFGDTIYADRAPNATTLDGYRGKYLLGRSFPALRRIFTFAPTYNMWDDHEVVNDFAGTTADPAMFAAGRRAFQEYMPIDNFDDASVMYRSVRWGKELEMFILDERSYRSPSAAPACTGASGNPDPLPAGAAPDAAAQLAAVRAVAQLPPPPDGCLDAINDPSRTLLGAEQKAWLKKQLTASDATWKVIINPVPVQALAFLPYDRWDGYAAERRELLEFIRDNGLKNVVFLTTDFHANIFGPVLMDPFGDDSDRQTIAYEAIAGPIATTPLQQDVVAVIGEAQAGLLPRFLTGVIGVECAALDAYAYGLVEIDPAGALRITAKDKDGTVLCQSNMRAG
jgi:alkaline phosphatase D